MASRPLSHRAAFARRKGKRQLALIDRSPELEVRASWGDITIFRIRPNHE
jgi:hypothetical protein